MIHRDGTMTISSYNKFDFLYRIFCIGFALVVIASIIHRYCLNNLASTSDTINYFESEKDLQPAFSVCVVDPKLDIKIKAIDPNYNSSTYIRLWRGEIENEKLRSFNFDAINFHWSDYFYKAPQARLEANDGTFLGYDNYSMNWRYYTSFIGLQSYKRYLTYCIAVEPLSRNVSTIKLYLNQTIFENGLRPHSSHKLRVYMHYPGQIFRSYSTAKTAWKKLNNDTRYHMKFRVQQVQVLHRYQKRNNRCLEDWKNYDKFVLDLQLKAAGCRAPYQISSNLIYPICSEKGKMKETVIHPSNIMMKQFLHPCRSMEQAYYKYTESYSDSDSTIPKGGFRISFYFNTQYKETMQYQQINGQVSFRPNTS